MFSFVLIFFSLSFSLFHSILCCSLSRFTVVMSKLNGGYTKPSGDNGNWSSRRSGFLFHSPHTFFYLSVFLFFLFRSAICSFFVLGDRGNVALVLFVLLPLTAVGNH